MIGNIEDKIANNSKKAVSELSEFIDHFETMKKQAARSKDASFDAEKADLDIAVFKKAIKALKILDKLKLAQATSCDPMVYGHAAIDILENDDGNWREHVYETYEKVVSTGNRLDKQEVIDTVLRHCNNEGADTEIYRALADEIQNMEVGTAYWVLAKENSHFKYHCSSCEGGTKSITKFCPHCGMKMDTKVFTKTEEQNDDK